MGMLPLDESGEKKTLEAGPWSSEEARDGDERFLTEVSGSQMHVAGLLASQKTLLLVTFMACTSPPDPKGQDPNMVPWQRKKSMRVSCIVKGLWASHPPPVARFVQPSFRVQLPYLLSDPLGITSGFAPLDPTSGVVS